MSTYPTAVRLKLESRLDAQQDPKAREYEKAAYHLPSSDEEEERSGSLSKLTGALFYQATVPGDVDHKSIAASSYIKERDRGEPKASPVRDSSVRGKRNNVWRMGVKDIYPDSSDDDTVDVEKITLHYNPKRPDWKDGSANALSRDDDLVSKFGMRQALNLLPDSASQMTSHRSVKRKSKLATADEIAKYKASLDLNVPTPNGVALKKQQQQQAEEKRAQDKESAAASLSIHKADNDAAATVNTNTERTRATSMMHREPLDTDTYTIASGRRSLEKSAVSPDGTIRDIFPLDRGHKFTTGDWLTKRGE
ncbi:hypothetical protein CBS101457_002935 [Exobasidium rhododendri]|nr:hypothetical protein CBS101457_002935 [Exobasidium rhododendri]